MTKTTFVTGTLVTADFLNSINNLQFTGDDIDGHLPKITDNSLDDSGIKSDVYDMVSGMEVSHGSLTTFAISEGSYRDLNGDTVSIAPVVMSLPSSGIFYIQLTPDGYTYSTDVLPVSRVLARVELSGSSLVSLTDLRNRPTLVPNTRMVRMFGGLGSEKSLRITDSLSEGWDGDTYNAPSSYLLQGERYLKDFTVDAGSSLTVPGGAIIYASGNVDIRGIIVVTPVVSGGRGFSGTVLTPSDIWSSNGNGVGGGSGHGDGSPQSYSYTTSNSGSGGASSYVKTRLQGSYSLTDINEQILVYSAQGGSGGGFFVVEAGGSVFVSGSINCPGSDAGVCTLSGQADATQFAIASGAGGGSGGLIWIKSATQITLTPASTLKAPGGDGGSGAVTSNVSALYGSAGGGGGSGGWVVVQAPSLILDSWDSAINVDVSGGSAGAIVGNAGNTVAGSSGGSYAGIGGSSGASGSDGQLITQTFSPI